MDPEVHLRHVVESGRRIAEVATGRLSDAVPTCPDWNVGNLLTHTGEFCAIVCERLERNAQSALRFGDTSPDDPLAWHLEQHADLVAALDSRDPEQPTWTWSTDQRVAFWYRRAAQELAVHRVDAEIAAGVPLPIDAGLAADGVDELLDAFLPRRPGILEGSGETYHFHATDTPGEWLVRALDGREEITREHAKGDVAARGTASDLLLFMWGRVPADRLEVFGDAPLLARWQERVRI